MKFNSLPIRTMFSAFALMFCCLLQASAQTAIITAPSTDTLTPGRTYLEVGLVSHLESHQNGGFQSWGIKAIHGFKGRVEVGVNVGFVNALEDAQPVEFQPNFKWTAYSNEENGLSVATGGMLFMPAINRADNKTTGLTYVVASKKLKGDHLPRLTTGMYTLVGQIGDAARMGVITGIEQPLNSKVSVFADWLSGNNRMGYGSAGLSITVGSRGVLGLSYDFGNVGRKNNTINVAYGVTF